MFWGCSQPTGVGRGGLYCHCTQVRHDAPQPGPRHEASFGPEWSWSGRPVLRKAQARPQQQAWGCPWAGSFLWAVQVRLPSFHGLRPRGHREGPFWPQPSPSLPLASRPRSPSVGLSSISVSSRSVDRGRLTALAARLARAVQRTCSAPSWCGGRQRATGLGPL